MNFEDTFFYSKNRFSIGIEKESGKYYLSIPVSNGIVDYEEYYEISEDEFKSFKNDPTSAEYFVDRCRNRQQDNLLILAPGANRGIPS